MQRRDASLIRVVNSALLPSSSPHPALTCLTILPGLRVWKPQSNEGMDCAMNGSCCVIFTFPGLSPQVFHYNNSHVRSDKADVVAIRHDNSPNLSDLLYLALLGSREDNGTVGGREKIITYGGFQCDVKCFCYPNWCTANTLKLHISIIVACYTGLPYTTQSDMFHNLRNCL